MSGRKVCKNFDKNKGYSVNVSDCTEEMKKAVQQVFFDVGVDWLYKLHSCEYQNLDAVLYTNVTCYGRVTPNLMYASTTWGCNMTAEEFLELVYEPKQQGHIHAELMVQYAEDAKSHPEPWRLWQSKGEASTWWDCKAHPMWGCSTEYRRKPKTKLIYGVEIPVFDFTPKVGEKYYTANVGLPELFEDGYMSSEDCTFTQRMIERGLLYPCTEEGMEAAILHSKAMLGIA